MKREKKFQRMKFFFILCFMLSLTVQSEKNGLAATYKKGFTYKELSVRQKKQITGCSYPKSGAKIKLSQLRAVKVKYYNMKGKTCRGTLIVNKKIAKKTAQIFYDLYQIKYRIEKISLIDEYGANDISSMEANNTSAFNYRLISGSSKLSKHGMGLAIDLNPRINPCVKKGRVEPANGKIYKERRVGRCKGKCKKYMIHKNDRVYKIFKKYGFTWGGDWKSLKDYQHFEYK